VLGLKGLNAFSEIIGAVQAAIGLAFELADAPSSTGVGGPKVQPCSRRISNNTPLLPLFRF
jgi:hypothetical protein